MQEAVDSLTLNNTVLTNRKHPVIKALNEVGIFDYAVTKKSHGKYVLGIKYESPEYLISESRRSEGAFDVVDADFITIVMEFRSLIPKK